MIKVPYIQVLLEKNERCTHPLWILPWELPVMAAAQGSNSIGEMARKVVERKRAPDPAAEFERMANRYRAPEGSEKPYVADVYGHGARGLATLKREIDDALDAANSVEFVRRPAPVSDAEKAVGGSAEGFASPFGISPDAVEEADLAADNAAQAAAEQDDLAAFAGGADSPTDVSQ